MTYSVDDEGIRKLLRQAYGSADPTPVDVEAGLADVARRASIKVASGSKAAMVASRAVEGDAAANAARGAVADTDFNGSRIRVLIGQRGRLFRESLAAVMSGVDDIDVVATLDHADDILPAAKRDRPHVAVLDAMLPGTITLSELCLMLGRALPTGRVLVLLDRQTATGVGRSLARLAPRVGFLGTETSPVDLIESVRLLARGEPVLGAEVAVAALTAGDNPLTDRECEVLRLALDGTPPKEIAQTLYLSAGTVRNYLSRILTKTGARSRIEAIRIAQDSGWI